jgi:hypothetical protein
MINVYINVTSSLHDKQKKSLSESNVYVNVTTEKEFECEENAYYVNITSEKKSSRIE